MVLEKAGLRSFLRKDKKALMQMTITPNMTEIRWDKQRIKKVYMDNHQLRLTSKVRKHHQRYSCINREVSLFCLFKILQVRSENIRSTYHECCETKWRKGKMKSETLARGEKMMG